VDALNRDDVESVQTFLHFWDQHVSTWHPDKNCPPARIHPYAQLFNTLQDTKKELAEMLNRLQHHTKCAPGYCEWKKKGSGEIFCRFGYPKTCRDHSELSKDPGRDFVELNTRRNDEILNSYNATFILGWRANIDFRPVISKDAVIAYVAKYASKGETTSSSYQDTLQKAISCLQDSEWHIKKCFHHLQLNVTFLVKKHVIYSIAFFWLSHPANIKTSMLLLMKLQRVSILKPLKKSNRVC